MPTHTLLIARFDFKLYQHQSVSDNFPKAQLYNENYVQKLLKIQRTMVTICTIRFNVKKPYILCKNICVFHVLLTIYSTPYTINNIQYAIHNIQYSIYNTLYKICILQYPIYNKQYTIYDIQYTMYNKQYAIHNIKYILYNIKYHIQ